MTMQRKNELIYHIPRMLTRAFIGGALAVLFGCGLLYLKTTGRAILTDANQYLGLKTITIDPKSWCVTLIRDPVMPIRVRYTAEIVPLDGNEEGCKGGGVATIQPKPRNTFKTGLISFVSAKPACTPVIDRESTVQVLYEFTIDGAHKTAFIESKPFTLEEKGIDLGC